jgi:hypothetical protein
MGKSTCSVDGCVRDVASRGWCNRHYRMWRLHGDPTWTQPIVLCVVDGCEVKARSGGMCASHYQRWYYDENKAAILAYQKEYGARNSDRIRAYQQSPKGRGVQSRSRARRREWLNAIKLERGCIDCGFKTHAAALQFDHRDPETKIKSSHRRRGMTTSWSKERLLAEIAKCDVRCANCHAIRGFEEGHHNIGHERLGHWTSGS